MSNFTIEQVIEKYLELREQIELINAETKKKLEPINKAMEGIESYLMATANSTGQTQFGTSAGTAFITTSNQCGVADFEATKRFLIEEAINAVLEDIAGEQIAEYTDEEDKAAFRKQYLDMAMEKCNWHLLNKAVNKTAVGEYIDQHQSPPPGVKWTAMKVIQVRKKSAGKNIK